MAPRHYCYGLTALFSIGGQAQQVFLDSLIVPGYSFGVMADIPDDGFVTAGSSDGNVVVVKWTAGGDTVWTRFHAHPHPVRCILPLSTNEFLVTTFYESLLLDQNGELLSVVPIYGSDVIEVGADSLVSAAYSEIRLTDRYGDPMWSVPMTIAAPHADADAKLVQLGSRVHAIAVAFDAVDTAVVRLGEFDLSGALLDSTLIRAMDGMVSSVESFRRTLDGGALAVVRLSLSWPLLVRVDANGDTLWTRYSTDADPEPGYPINLSLGGARELPGGHFVVPGLSVDSTGWNCLLMELDAQGGVECIEHTGITGAGWSGLHFCDVVVEPPSRSITMFGLGNNQTEVWRGMALAAFDELCPSNGIVESPTAAAIPSVVLSDGFFVDPAPVPGNIYSVYNELGQVVLSKEGSGALDLGGQPPGIYVLIIVNSNASRAVRLLKP